MSRALGIVPYLVLSALAISCGFGLQEPTPLTRAIADQDFAKVERFLDEGADPNKPGLLFPLQIAAARENVEILKLLLTRGAVLERAVNKDNGWSPLFAAAQNGPPDAVQVLLDAGADPCVRTSASWVRGLRPSEVAHKRGNPRVAPILEAAEQARCPK